MEQQYDINTIDAHDFNTPRKKNNKNNVSSRQSLLMQRIGSNHEISLFSPDHNSFQRNLSTLLNDKILGKVNRDIKSTTLHTSPFQSRQPIIRQSSQDYTSNISDFSVDKINLNSTSLIVPINQPQKQFSFSKESYDQLSQQVKQEQQQEPQINPKYTNNMKSTSPLGIPYQPFHHTKSGFKSKSHLIDKLQQQPNQQFNSSLDDDNFYNGNEQMGDSQYAQIRNKSCFIQRDDNNNIMDRYDQKILDISDTLKQLQQYKSNLHLMQQNQKKRSKSHHSPHARIDNIGKLPAIKQPNMYFSPMDEPSPKHQKKLKKAKKQKQQGMQTLAKQILNNLPQEKLANLMAVNMYNQALMKKEINQEKITNVIEEQNKLLSKMLEQYEKKQIDTKKTIRSNLLKVEGDKSYESQKFEKDKRSFEKAYTNIQSKFLKEANKMQLLTTIQDENYMSRPLLTEGDLPDQIRNTKHLKRIHTHSLKYKQFTPQKISQPPMQF